MSVESNNQVRDLIGQAIDNGRYIIERLIGQGGMGQVYEARQVSMGRQVAIKILHMNLTNNEELISRFETEALSISRLNHPNIITIYDYGRTEDGMLFMVMELLQGATLDRVIRREQGVTQPRGLTLMRQVANAVSEAHRLGVVHRDLKPENIYLHGIPGQPERAKVLDFGIAKIIHGEAGPMGKGTNTAAGSVFGTPQYMSPEQVHGEVIDHRSDIYSLGIILFELLAGKTPYHSSSPVGAMLAHISEPLPELSDINPYLSVDDDVRELIIAATAKDRGDRLQSVAEFLERLDDIEGLEGRSSPSIDYSNDTEYETATAVTRLATDEQVLIAKSTIEVKTKQNDEIGTIPPPKDAAAAYLSSNTYIRPPSNNIQTMPPPTDAPTAVLPEQVPSSKEHADETSIDMLTGRSRTNPSLPNIEFDPDQGLEVWNQRRSTRNLIWTTVLIIGVVVGAILYFQMLETKKREGIIPVPGHGAIKKITYTIESIPTDADIYSENKIVGRTPLRAKFARGRALRLVVRKKGYQTRKFDLSGKGLDEQVFTIKLKRR